MIYSCRKAQRIITIYARMIYRAPYVMFLMRADPLRGQVEGGAGLTGDSKSTNERGTFLVGSFGLSCRYRRYLFCLMVALVGPLQNIFSSPYTIKNSFVPIATAGTPVSRYVSLVWFLPVISLLLTNTV
jgi:hypothetical protein